MLIGYTTKPTSYVPPPPPPRDSNPPPPRAHRWRMLPLWGGGGVGWDPPSSQGPPMVPAEGGPKIFELSWHRSKLLAVSLKHRKVRRRGGGGSRGGPGGGG